MKRISRPAGLPQSCAEMVRLSGVFTAIGLYFNSCPKLGPAATASNEVATIALSRQQVCSDIVIGNPPTRSRLYRQVYLQDRSKSLLVVTPQMPLTTNESRIHRHSTVSVGNGWQ